MLIAIEGIDGSGKTTVATRLAAALEASGRRVLLTREPGGTAIGEGIRRLILDRGSSGLLAEAEALLFAASRAQLVGEVIRPALESGTVVITDRFTDSSLAYQSGGRSLDAAALRNVQEFATGGLQPDLKVLLDIAPELAVQRRHRRPEAVNRLDNEEIAFYERVRQVYCDLARDEPERWRVIAADEDPDAVWTRVWQVVQRHLAQGESGVASGEAESGARA